MIHCGLALDATCSNCNLEDEYLFHFCRDYHLACQVWNMLNTTSPVLNIRVKINFLYGSIKFFFRSWVFFLNYYMSLEKVIFKCIFPQQLDMNNWSVANIFACVGIKIDVLILPPRLIFFGNDRLDLFFMLLSFFQMRKQEGFLSGWIKWLLVIAFPLPSLTLLTIDSKILFHYFEKLLTEKLLSWVGD